MRAVSCSGLVGRLDAGADPVTGADLSSISPAGVTAIIKAVYDVLHNERHAAPAGDGDTAPEGEG